MPAKQLTTAELDSLIEGVVRRNSKADSKADRDRLRKEYDSLINQKNELIRQQKQRAGKLQQDLREAELYNKDLKKRLNENYYDGESDRNRSSEDRSRTGTAGDAQREYDRRRGRERNPARGNVDPNAKYKDPRTPNIGDKAVDAAKKTGQDGLAQIKEWNKGLKTQAGKVSSYVNNTKAGKFAKSASDGLAKTAGRIGRSPVGKLGRAAGKVLGPLGDIAQLHEAVTNVVEKSPIQAEIEDNQKFKSGLEDALIAIMTKQNRMRRMLEALSTSNGMLMSSQAQLIQAVAALAESIDAIEDYSQFSRNKLGAVNFAAIQQSADNAAAASQSVQKKINQVNFAAIVNGVKTIDGKLPDNGIFRIDQTGVAKRTKELLDPSFKTIDGKLPDNGIFRIDQTGVAKRTKELLDPSFKTIDGKLPDNGIFRIDQTGVAKRVNELLNLAPLTSHLTRIEGKIGQPVNLAPLTSHLTRIEGKIPVIPGDLARKSDVNVTVKPIVNPTPVNVAPTPVTVNPTPVTVNPTPVTVNPTPVTVNPTPVNLAPITGQIADFARSLTQAISNQTTNITNVVNNAPKTDLKPVLDAIAPLSTVLGVPLLKNGLNFGADKTFTDLARKSSNGSGSLTIPSIPELIMAAAAVPYARQGLHRLGGNFDKSVMVPSRGQVKITDTLGFQKWAFDQIDERLGMPTAHSIKGASGQLQAKSFRSVQDTVEEVNALTLASAQDLEVVERYLFALTQDLQKLMQIALQTREDVDLVISDLGCKYQEVKRSHPTHINLKEGSPNASLEQLFQNGRVYYVGKKWADASDKNQRLERIGYDTQIAAMSNKFEFDKTAPELPLDKSRATRTPQSNELWRTFVSTITDPPEGYTAPGNPIPEIKEITTGTPKAVPKPTNPSKKLGQ